MHPHRVTVSDGVIHVPGELHAAMGHPRAVRLVPAEGPTWDITAASAYRSVLAHGANTVRRLLPGRSPIPVLVARQAGGDLGEHLGFKARGRLVSMLADGEYTISNHHPFYFLMPADDSPAHESRQSTWAGFEGYHEHLPADEQEDRANRVSAWLAGEVLAPLGAASFLELGCGGGRNLLWLRRQLPEAELHAVEINPRGVETARRQVPDANIQVGSLYELERFADDSIDVVYSVAVLEHVPHNSVGAVIREMHRIARIAVVNQEMHGPSHRFDFHRYPRDYRPLYAELGLGTDFTYEVWPDRDFRSAGTNFQYALALSRKAGTPASATRANN